MGFCNKISYPTKLSARIAGIALNQKTGEKFRAYYCEYHNAWHNTSRKKGRYAKKDRSSKQVSYRKRAILEATEESDFRRIRNIREWEPDITRQDSRDAIMEEK